MADGYKDKDTRWELCYKHMLEMWGTEERIQQVVRIGRFTELEGKADCVDCYQPL